MSYILDALKKNQAADQADQAGLAPRSSETTNRPTTTTWLLGILVLVLGGNIIWLGWREFNRPNNVVVVNAQPTQSAEPAVAIQTTSPDQTEQTTAQTVTTPEPTPVAQSSPAQVATAARPPVKLPGQRTPVVRADTPNSTGGQDTSNRIEPRQSTGSLPVKTSPVRKITNKVSLSELSGLDRMVYETFNYTTHIYTDDPSLCAVVINGKRLEVGDSIEDLVVAEITPEGVIFAERSGSSIRHVEVSILDELM